MSDDIVTRLREEADSWCHDSAVRVFLEAADEIERLRAILRQASDELNAQADEVGDEIRAVALEAEQWWIMAAQYRNSGDHAARCLGNLRCRLCSMFHQMEARYGKRHAPHG